MVGVIDSGIGGLTVLKRLRSDFNNLSFVYYGDNENAPYGNKSTEELIKRLNCVLTEVRKCNIDCLVVACNTLSVTFKSEFENFDIPVILTLPVKEREGDYLLCTPKTSLCKYVKDEFLSSVTPMPMLASEIELNPFALEKVNVKSDLKGVPDYAKRLVLGCTHYLYIEDKIRNLSGLETVNGLYHVSKKMQNLVKSGVIKLEKTTNFPTFIGESKDYNRKIYVEVLKGF